LLHTVINATCVQRVAYYFHSIDLVPMTNPLDPIIFSCNGRSIKCSEKQFILSSKNTNINICAVKLINLRLTNINILHLINKIFGVKKEHSYVNPECSIKICLFLFLA
jgi:hypothetical protein